MPQRYAIEMRPSPFGGLNTNESALVQGYLSAISGRHTQPPGQMGFQAGFSAGPLGLPVDGGNSQPERCVFRPAGLAGADESVNI